MSNDKIRQYIQENPKYLTGYYQDIAIRFNITYERARHIARSMRQTNQTDHEGTSDNGRERQDSSFKENVSTGEATQSFVTPIRITTKEDIIKACNIDLTEYDITSWEVTTWEIGRKDKKTNLTWAHGVVDGEAHDSGKINTETLYRVNVKLKRRSLDTDLLLQKELILAEIKSHVPHTEHSFLTAHNDLMEDLSEARVKGKYLLEICLFDFHWGKFSWSAETGEDFDLKIAEQRFKDAIYKILSRVDITMVGKILFPIGNDLINIDNKNHTTTAGTPQDTDSRFMKIIQVVRRVLVEVVDELSIIAPVDIVIVRGNHDETSSFMIGEILDAFYFSNPLVQVDNGPKLRKYYTYGKTALMFSHGNEEKHNDLGLIFATEEPLIWSGAEFRFCQLGHYHSNKKIQYMSVNEHQGFQVQIIPSLTSADAWHYKKGYMSKKQAKAFLFHESEGLIGELTISI